MQRRVWIVLTLLLVLLAPKVALAGERETVVESGSGIEVQMDGERGLLAAPNATPLTSIRNSVNAWNKIQVNSGTRSILSFFQAFFYGSVLGGSERMALVIGLVFFWWGVRKVKNIVLVASKKGRLNV